MLLGKSFTLQEAEALLPELKERLESLRGLKRSMEEKSPVVAQYAEKGRENSGGPHGSKFIREILQFQSQLEGFSKTGCILRDLERGLLDFPHHREGRLVYLSWAWGEEGIRWWYEQEEGFAHRQRL